MRIHAFADASIKCYGACIFLRSTDDRGENMTSLVCEKSRDAPLKIISLPSLELFIVLLLARMAHRLIPKLNLNITKKKKIDQIL